jgi:hypothetical protein
MLLRRRHGRSDGARAGQGRSSADESEGPAFDAAKQLHDRFRARYKVICCRGLTRKLPWGEPAHHLACQEYVRFAADEVADLLRARPDAGSEFPG